MLLYSFTEVILNLGPMFACLFLPFIVLPGKPDKSLAAMRNARLNLNPVSWFRDEDEVNPEDEDYTPPQDRIPTLWWTVGVLSSTIMCCAILAKLFSMNVGEAILSLVLGFIFSFVGVQSSGHTDINPVTTVAKVFWFLILFRV